MIRSCLSSLVNGADLTYQESQRVMREIMSGETTDAQIAAFLTALRMKGETVEEITAFTAVMRKYCCHITPQVHGRLVDTCGTGADKIKTFNIITQSFIKFMI